MVSNEQLFVVVIIILCAIFGNGFIIWGKINKIEGKFCALFEDRKRCFEHFRVLDEQIRSIEEKI